MTLTAARKTKKIASKAGSRRHFSIVAIGASLGGLKAVIQLLKYLPDKTGMAYIYVQHLDPNHKSFLTGILSKATKMKVQEIEDMAFMQPDNIYVIPYNKGIEVTNGHIKLLPRSKSSASVSIDTLFSSLALTHKRNVLGIILSGNGKDGTKGIEAIKKAGGITFAQDRSAQAKSMPDSAIEAGVIDFVLSPKEIALELGRFSESGFKILRAPDGKDNAADNDLHLRSLFKHLHKETSVDFSHYKMTTLKRRIQHRMTHNSVPVLNDYIKLLVKKKEESDALYKDLLINVTSFFRDPATFRYLKSTFLPGLLKDKSADKMLRIWVPGCSTGEEAYSIAMLIIELQENRSRTIPVKIFATDLSNRAIRSARLGEYSREDIKEVSPARLKRFFVKSACSWRVVKELREMCVFAPHNILKDPPFYKIDFISCCNLLIYFDAAAQKKAIATLHFALKDNGHLMLGRSESTGTSAHLFSQVNNKYRIYSRKKSTGVNRIPELTPRFSTSLSNKRLQSAPSPMSKSAVNSMELDSVIDSALLSNYMPACAVINKSMDILQFRGSTSVYLTHPSGRATLNILKMARPEFSLELRTAIAHALKTKEPVKRSGIEMNAHVLGATMRTVTIEVTPLKIEWDEPLLIVVFTTQEGGLNGEDTDKEGKRTKGSLLLQRKAQKIKELTEELARARGEIHAVIESQEVAYQELQIANEEIVSANEEFQTLNEELETSKEEIEATNEELISTNQELQLRNDLLQESYNYSETIIGTLHEPMLILNEKLRIKSASKSFYKKFHTRKEDTEGEFIFDLGNKQWKIPQLIGLLEEVRLNNKDFDNFEVTHVFPGIGEKTMLLNAHKIVQRNHKEQLILLAINDITEHTRLYRTEKNLLNEDILLHKRDNVVLEKAVRRRTRQLELKNKELEEANKDLISFTYISSHDLQEPLRKIQTFATCILLEEEKKLSVTGKGYFLRMREIAQRMQTLIENLLTYSRAKNGTFNFEESDLNPLLADVIHDFEEKLKEKNAKIVVKDLHHASVVRFQFRQLFQNLIGNSLKFTRSDVPPYITVRSKIVKREQIKDKILSDAKKYLHIIYVDNGIGFDPQYRERIFEVFQRLHSFDEYNGTGIGLAICKRIVENHRGWITANAKPNEGARFDIYIPYKYRSEEKKETAV
jgi:two-component system, chemotaxis family, CheB/CheR fusion protein